MGPRGAPIHCHPLHPSICLHAPTQQGEEGGEPRKPRARSGEDGPQGSVDSQDFQEEDADRAFLEDDEGGCCGLLWLMCMLHA